MTDRAPIQTIGGYPIQELLNNISRVSESTGIAVLRRSTVTLTDAQIKALPTTPVEILPAPGPGKFLNIINACLFIDTVAGAYTNIKTDYQTLAFYIASVEYNQWELNPIGNDETTEPQPMTRLTETLGVAQFTRVTCGPFTQPYQYYNAMFPFADSINKPLMLYVDVAGDFTGGHANNSMKIKVYYTIEDA